VSKIGVYIVFLSICLTLVSSGCGTLPFNIDTSALLRAGGAQLPVGPEEEASFGGAVAVMIVQNYGGIEPNTAWNEYVNLVGQGVAMHSTRPNLAYHFAILASDDVNALSAPGGYVFVTRGALKACQSEAELAAILAHEVGHIAAGHATRILQNLKSAAAAVEGVPTGGATGEVFKGILDKFLSDYLAHGLPADDEFEADRLGTQVATRVGWRSTGLQAFLRRMGEKPNKSSHFFATHPDTTERVKRLGAVVTSLGAERGVDLRERFAASMAPLAVP
jgi:predicted Zn-dependent protease